MLDVLRPRGDLKSLALPLVDRPRLLRRLREAETAVVLLNAPSGYGKSVLLAQWADQDPRRFESITLTGDHNDPALLVRAIVQALGRIEALSEQALSQIDGPVSAIEKSLLPRLGRALGECKTAFVLLLDNVEQVESPESLRAVASLSGMLPVGSHLALASRTDPAIPIGRLRAHQGLTELGRHDLAMSKAECQDLIVQLGLEPTPEQLDALFRHTEGWPAAVYLAGLAVVDTADLGEAITAFAGDDRIVVDYIREEFLAGLSRRRLEFLRRLSILDRVNGQLSDQVLGRTGSATALRDLSRSNMLLMPLDRRDEWFRFHPLLREMLHGELHRTEPELEAELHRRAADWWAEQGRPDQAIDHAIEAEDLARAGRQIWQIYPEYSSGGHRASIKRWLDRIGPGGVASEPHLSLAAAFDGLARGSSGEGDQWASIASPLVAKMPSSPAKVELEGALALMSASLALAGAEKMVDDAETAGEALGEGSTWLYNSHLIEGIALHLRGLRDRARKRLGEGARHAAAVSPTTYVLCLAQLALLAIDQGDWREGEGFGAQARAQLERSGVHGHALMTLGLAISSLVSAHCGQLARAAADSRRAQKLLDEFEELPPWCLIETRVTLARTAVRLDDAPTATMLLDDATRLLGGFPDAIVLEQWVEQTRASVAAVAASGITDLTPAELRVLQYMTTHLSFTEIANEIVVSANTVKTQAQGVYRKLGVTSRREAVDEAGRIGLIDSGVPGGALRT